MNLNDRFMIDEDNIVYGGCPTCGAIVENFVTAVDHNEWHNELERFIEWLKLEHGYFERKEV